MILQWENLTKLTLRVCKRLVILCWAFVGHKICWGGTWMDKTSNPLLKYRLPYLFKWRFFANIHPKRTTKGRWFESSTSAVRSSNVLSIVFTLTGVGRSDWWRQSCVVIPRAGNTWITTKWNYMKQEAFKERRHFHVCDLWPCGVTLTFCQGQESWCH